MSKIVIRIGNALKGDVLTPAFAVDIEERKHADANHIRVRVENEHLRLRDTLREGLADMLVEKSALVYTGAKVVITINKVYGKRGESATADGKCRVEVQFKDNCPREFRDGAFKIYDNIVKSPKIAAIVAELAKVDAIKRKLDSQMPTESIDVWSKTMNEWVEADRHVVGRCRAIAEEGVNNGK